MHKIAVIVKADDGTVCKAFEKNIFAWFLEE